MKTEIKKSAIISEDNKYRYVLTRVFDEKLPMVAFIGLNPSTADADIDDRTITKCVIYTRNWGYGGFYMLNLFAYRTTDSKELLKQADPVGPENDKYLKTVLDKVDKVICCWGDMGYLHGRNMYTRSKIKIQHHCLGVNDSGEPSQVLYLKPDLKPFIYDHNSIYIGTLKGRLKKQFGDQLKAIGNEFNIEINKCNLLPGNWKHHTICFSDEVGGIRYGIKRNKPDKNKSRLIEIEDAFTEKFEVSEWWPMYRPFYENINTEMNFWTDIKEGKAKQKARFFIKTILAQFDTNAY